MAETGWTKGTPRVSGWYWAHWRGQINIIRIEVGEVWGMLTAEAMHLPDDTEFYGPLNPPITPEDQQ